MTITNKIKQIIEEIKVKKRLHESVDKQRLLEILECLPECNVKGYLRPVVKEEFKFSSGKNLVNYITKENRSANIFDVAQSISISQGNCSDDSKYVSILWRRRGGHSPISGSEPASNYPILIKYN